MPPFEWHLKFAEQMVDLADRQRNRNAWVACHAILRAFEEIIDAYGAKDGFQFHDSYPIEAWQERIRWMCEFKPDLLDEWNDLTRLCARVQLDQSYHIIFQMSRIVRDRLSMVGECSPSDQTSRNHTAMKDT